MSVSKDNELSNSSMDDSSDELGEPGSQIKLEENFHQLLRFKVDSHLDQILLEGLFSAKALNHNSKNFFTRSK